MCFFVILYVKITVFRLCISGSKLIPAASPVHKAFSSVLPGIPLAESSIYSFLEEEIYDAEGKIEEFLAFDNKDL